MYFENYPAERLYIDSIDSRLSPEGKNARLEIMNFTIDNQRPYNINSDASPQILEVIEELREKNAAVISSDGEIQFIYPVSAIPTGHKVMLEDGRKFSAMCAIDAMGAAFTYRQNVTIESACAHCGESVRVTVKDGGLDLISPSTVHALYFDLNSDNEWAANC